MNWGEVLIAIIANCAAILDGNGITSARKEFMDKCRPEAIACVDRGLGMKAFEGNIVGITNACMISPNFKFVAPAPAPSPSPSPKK